MEFDSKHRVKIETLNATQAPVVVEFLQDERKRHRDCILEADFLWSMRPIIDEIYESAAIRHQEAIGAIDIKIIKIKEMYGL